MYPLASMSSWPLKEIGVGTVPDRDEDPGARQICRLAGHEILESDAGHYVIAENVFDDGVPDERDLFVLHRAVLHDFGGSQFVAPVDDRDLGREFGQEGRFLHRTVAAADDNQFLSFEEESVAGRTG